MTPTMPMTNPTVLSMLMDSIDDLKETVDRRFDQQDKVIEAIKVQTTATNGRVGKLELTRARMEGARGAYRWVGPVLGSVFCGTGGTIVTLIITGKIG